MKTKLLAIVQRWQYNPYGSRRHNFAFRLLTGGSFSAAVSAAIRRPYRYINKKGKA